jgi:hypothetical protein
MEQLEYKELLASQAILEPRVPLDLKVPLE